MCESCREAERREAERREAEAEAKAEAERIAALPKRVLTRETVEAGNPCYTYSERFEERFPESVEVTVELALSQADDWDWWWAARNLLTKDGYQEYSRRAIEAERIFDSTMHPYWEAVDRKATPAWERHQETERREMANGKSYGEAYRIALAVYEEEIAIEVAARDAVYKVANRRLQEAKARAWAEIYISEKDSPEPIGYKVRYDEYDESYDY